MPPRSKKPSCASTNRRLDRPPDQHSGRGTCGPPASVGAARVGDIELYIEPKEPVARLRETTQISRHAGLALPVEIRHDEYTVDIPENRILATARRRPTRLNARLRVALRLAELVLAGGSVEAGRDGVVRAVVDAKYKAVTVNADVYQMLAYCTIYGLRRGHLVYVSGDHPPLRHVVRNAGIEIVCHALDLALEPAALLARVRSLADDVVCWRP